MRIVVAALITILTFGIFGGALGFASAQSEPVEVRTLWPGDAGAYQVTFGGPFLPTQFNFESLFQTRFEVLDTEPLTMPDGSNHIVAPLRMEYENPFVHLQGLTFPTQQEKFYEQWLFSGVSPIAQGGSGSFAYNHTLGSTSYSVRAFEFYPNVPCLFAHPGAQSCSMPRPFAGEISYMEWNEEDAGEYFVRAQFDGEPVSLKYRFLDDLPFASMVSVSESQNLGITMKWEMKGFQAGTPTTWTPPSPATIAGDMAPVQPWGLDESGTDMTYPAGDAFTAAQQDLLYSDLRDFLALYPTAETVHAVPRLVQHDGRMEHEWEFGLLLGSQQFHFTATTHTPSMLELPTVSAYQFETVDSWPLQPLPSELPTAKSLMESADAMRELLANGESPTWKLENGLVAGGSWHAENAQQLPVDSTRQTAWYYEKPDGTSHSFEEETTTQSAPVTVFQDEAPSSVPGSAQGSTWTPPAAEAAAGIGFVSLIFGGLYYFWPAIKQGAFFGLFSRVKQDEVLLHPARSQIMEAVRCNPGIHRNALERETGLKSGTLRHHLDILTTKGKIISKKQGGFACYAVPEHYQHMAGAGAVKSDGAQNILETIQANPGTNARQVAASLQLSPGTVAYHVKRLREAGVIQSVREGRQTFLYLTDAPTPAA